MVEGVGEEGGGEEDEEEEKRDGVGGEFVGVLALEAAGSGFGAAGTEGAVQSGTVAGEVDHARVLVSEGFEGGEFHDGLDDEAEIAQGGGVVFADGVFVGELIGLEASVADLAWLGGDFDGAADVHDGYFVASAGGADETVIITLVDLVGVAQGGEDGYARFDGW